MFLLVKMFLKNVCYGFLVVLRGFVGFAMDCWYLFKGFIGSLDVLGEKAFCSSGHGVSGI